MAKRTIREIWRRVERDHRYDLHPTVGVRSWCNCNRGRAPSPHILKPFLDGGGYPQVNIAGKTVKVHHLMAEAFLDPPPGPIGCRRGEYQVNHKDGDKLNWHPSNLEWVDPQENHAHAAENRLTALGESHGMAIVNAEQVRKIRRRVSNGETQISIAMDFGISEATVWAIVHRKTWAHVI